MIGNPAASSQESSSATRSTLRPATKDIRKPCGARIGRDGDEYIIYGKLTESGYEHQTVCHANAEYARDEDGEGFREVHGNTIEGSWSLLRSWLRPHRGVSQENLPCYQGFLKFIQNVRRRGQALLPSLLVTLFALPLSTRQHRMSHCQNENCWG
jgi:hypothetical protein